MKDAGSSVQPETPVQELSKRLVDGYLDLLQVERGLSMRTVEETGRSRT